MVKTAILLIRQSLKGFSADEGPRMAAALAYYAAFSMAPLLLIVVAIGGAFFGDDAVRGALDEELRENMGPAAASLIQDMVANARKPAEGWIMSISGLFLLLLGAAGAFAQLQSALDKIWGVDPEVTSGITGAVKTRLLSFSMILVTGMLLLFSMILTTVVQAAGEQLGELSGFPIGAWVGASGFLSLVVTTLLFAAIFKILPNARVMWKDVWYGGFFTALLFMVGKVAVGWYLGREATTSSYGSAGAFVVILMWLHYSAAILLFGAEFTQNHAKLRGREFEMKGKGKGTSSASS